MSKFGMLFLSQAAAALGSVYDMDYPYHRERIRRENEKNNKMKESRIRNIAEKKLNDLRARQLHKFKIKGHEIEAYSRKDAIIKLKHIGIIEKK